MADHFKDPIWDNFLLTPITITRPYLRSRYLVFRNVMLEFLELTDESEGHKFAFFDEWKQSDKPYWVGCGIKVESLDYLFSILHKMQIDILELFTKEDPDFEKGFSHKSALIDLGLQGRKIYFTEYDLKFESARNQRLFHTDKDRDKLPAIVIEPINLTLVKPLLSFDENDRLCLDMNSGLEFSSFVTEWIVCKDRRYTFPD